MPKFELTALRDINVKGVDNTPIQVRRGDTFTITINLSGINKNNLFNNSRCIGQLQQQFAINNISLPKDSWLLKTSGGWNIKML